LAHVQQLGGIQLRSAAESLGRLTAGRIHISPELLKRAIPALVLVFVTVIIAGIGIHSYSAHGRTLVASASQLGLVADVTALRLAERLRADGGAPGQRDLSLALPDEATADGRVFLATDSSGFVRAAAPASTMFLDRGLITVLGPDQPLTSPGRPTAPRAPRPCCAG
jgi:two-component system cell cycle sensor histidine kinase PleC